MNKHKTKYQNTARKMNLALIELMEKKTIESITIKELCEKANVNRSTFYSHYQNLSDLWAETRSYIIHLFIEEMSHREYTLDDYQNLPDELLVPYLKVFSDNRNIFLISDFHQITSNFSADHMQIFMPIALSACQALGITDRTTIAYMTNFYYTGCHSIIMQWLKGGCQEEISYMCDLIRFCVLNPNWKLK